MEYNCILSINVIKLMNYRPRVLKRLYLHTNFRCLFKVSNQEDVLRAGLVVIKLTLPARPIKERQKRNSEKEQIEEEETNEFERK